MNISKERREQNIPFVGLHAHTVAGSVFDGLGYPQDHMDYAYYNGMDALAITDHGNANGLSYQVLHSEKMKKEGKLFKPIFGVEAYFTPSISEWKELYDEVMSADKKRKEELKELKKSLIRTSHLLLLATNQKGLNNLFKLISLSHRQENFYRNPRIDLSMLQKYNEGIIASSACIGGMFRNDYWLNKDENDSIKSEEDILNAMRKTCQNMVNIFGERWFGELQWNKIPDQHILNKYVLKLSKEMNFNVISTVDSHYYKPEVWKDRELYKRLGWLNSKNKPGFLSNEVPESVNDLDWELYPKNGDQMWEAYRKYSRVCAVEYDDEEIKKTIELTYKIAHEQIEDFMPNRKVRLPNFVVPKGKTEVKALTDLAIKGLREKKLHNKKEYVKRLKDELEIIRDRGFSKYFLTMKTISDEAQKVQLVGAGRGSGAGSLVSYVLNITAVDPIKWKLLFSRFLRRDATDYPDIDFDLSSPNEFKDLLIKKWGDTSVVRISNFNTLQLKSLIKDISKFYDIPFQESNEVTTKMIGEATPKAKRDHGIKAGVYVPTFDEVMKYSDTLKRFLEKYPNVKTHVNELSGQVRNLAKHAGGVLIAEELDMHMPLIQRGGVLQTPWSEGQNVRHLEPMGFIKFDLLGLASLRMIEGAIRHILKRHRGIKNPTFDNIKEYYDKTLHPDILDLNDQKVYEEIFHKGKWLGIFQFTEGGAQRFCKNGKPRSIVDLSALTSIYRPGPLSAKVDKEYLEAKENKNNIIYPHQIFKEVLEDTYGFMIFQEQLAMLAHKLGKGISLDEGNLLRKILIKKGTGKAEAVKNNLYGRFVEGCEEKGLSKQIADEWWEKMIFFSYYSFCLAHSTSYCILSYQCAWLCHYYPIEWAAAFLDKESDSKKEKAINLVKNSGFKIDRIDVNKSGKVWEIAEDGKTLVQPLSSILGLGDAAIEQILNNRPFNTPEELLFSENIIYSKLNKKCLDALIRSGAVNNLMDDRFTGKKHFWSSIVGLERPQSKKKFKEYIEAFAEEKDFTKEEEIEHLVDLTGTFPIETILTEKASKQFIEYDIKPISETTGTGVSWFIPRKVVNKKTKFGKDFAIITVIDINNKEVGIKCWGANKSINNKIKFNRLYMGRLDFDEKYGYSTNNYKKDFVLIK